MVIDDLINTERARYNQKGYDIIVSPFSVLVSGRLRSLSLSNDTYILTGISGSADDVSDGNVEILLTSPNNSLQATIRQVGSLGTSINRIFRRTLIIKTLGDKDISGKNSVIVEDDRAVPNYRLEFVKVTPVKRYSTTTTKSTK